MKKYRVLTEWVTLNGSILAGGEVELPEHEAAPFLGKALEAIETEPESESTEPKKKKAV
jgi:hypothetical protein